LLQVRELATAAEQALVTRRRAVTMDAFTGWRELAGSRRAMAAHIINLQLHERATTRRVILAWRGFMKVHVLVLGICFRV
jgi:hypothetical protein